MPVLKKPITCITCAARIAPTAERMETSPAPKRKHLSTEKAGNDGAITGVETRAGSSGHTVSQLAEGVDYVKVSEVAMLKLLLKTHPVRCQSDATSQPVLLVLVPDVCGIETQKEEKTK